MAKAKTITTIRDLTPDAANANRHSQRGMGMMETSITECGFGDSLTVDKNGHVISGNGRLETLAAIDMADAIVVQSDGTKPVIHQRTDLDLVKDTKAKRLAVLQNRVGQVNLDWDAQALAQLALEGVELDDLWSEDELSALLADVESEGGLADGADPDEVPGNAPTRCKSGELWKLGRHRLLCGDSTKREDVERLMGGEKAALCLTDPPYGLEDTNSEKNNYDVHNDTKDALAGIIAGFLPLAREVAPIVLLTPGNKNHRMYPEPTWTLAWMSATGTGCGPWGFCCWQPVLAYGKDPYLAAGKGSRPDMLNQSEPADKSISHPCTKPVGVWTWFMERGSIKPGDVIFEPFCGSGTGIIVAEMIERTCYAIELSPKYCDISIARWENATGQTAEKM